MHWLASLSTLPPFLPCYQRSWCLHCVCTSCSCLWRLFHFLSWRLDLIIQAPEAHISLQVAFPFPRGIPWGSLAPASMGVRSALCLLVPEISRQQKKILDLVPPSCLSSALDSSSISFLSTLTEAHSSSTLCVPPKQLLMILMLWSHVMLKVGSLVPETPLQVVTVTQQPKAWF